MIPGFTTSASLSPAARPNTTSIDQAVRSEAIGPVNTDAGGFADREQSRDNRVGIAILQRDDFAVIVRRDAAHVVVNGRHDRDRLASKVHAGERLRRLGDSRQSLGKDLRVDMVEVKEDMILVLADAPALADLHGH